MADVSLEACAERVVAQPLEVKRRIGYVPETGAVYQTLSVEEYLALVGALHHLGPAEIAERGNKMLSLFGIAAAAQQRIDTLSKGMRQKVVIISALLHDPDVLLFDEPLSGLDVSSALLFKHLVAELALRGKIILYISHVLEVVERICAKVIVIYKGQIKAEDSVSRLRDLMHLPSLEEIFTQLVQHENMEVVAKNIAEAISRGPA